MKFLGSLLLGDITLWAGLSFGVAGEWWKGLNVCVGDVGTWSVRAGGPPTVADLMGFFLSESFGRSAVLSVRRSIDFVLIARRLGALGLRGGGGRRKPARDDGGGDGESVRLESEDPELMDAEDDDETLVGIMGKGDRGIGSKPDCGIADRVDWGSISGRVLVRYVV
jgi:hypothetical protein